MVLCWAVAFSKYYCPWLPEGHGCQHDFASWAFAIIEGSASWTVAPPSMKVLPLGLSPPPSMKAHSMTAWSPFHRSNILFIWGVFLTAFRQWRDLDPKYHFSCQFTADLIAMNRCGRRPHDAWNLRTLVSRRFSGSCQYVTPAMRGI
jgi:Sucrose synthase